MGNDRDYRNKSCIVSHMTIKSTISNSAFVASQNNNFSHYLATQVTYLQLPATLKMKFKCFAGVLLHSIATFDKCNIVFAQKYNI